MNPIAPHRRRRFAVALGGLFAVTAVAAAAADSTSPAAAFDGPDVGIVCTTSPGTGPTFDMTTDADYINLPDGNTAYMYGYKIVGTQFQHPSPVLCVNQGDTVTISNAFSGVTITSITTTAGGVIDFAGPALEVIDKFPHIRHRQRRIGYEHGDLL